MFQFLSAIVLRNGDIVCVPESTDSHESLIRYARLDGMDSLYIQRFVRVLFTPRVDGDYANPDGYRLRVDEQSAPEWFDTAMRVRTTGALRERVRGMIITGRRRVIRKGCWIVAPGGRAGDVIGGRVVCVASGGTIRSVRDGGTVDDVRGRIGDVMDGGTVGDVWGKVDNVRTGGVVRSVWPGGRVGDVWGRVGDVLEGGTVDHVRPGGVVHSVRQGGHVGDVMADGRVSDVWGTVGSLRNGGTVGSVRSGGFIRGVRSGSRVGDVWPGSVVQSDE